MFIAVGATDLNAERSSGLEIEGGMRMPPVTSSLRLGKRRSRSSSKRVRSRITQITAYSPRRVARVGLSAG